MAETLQGSDASGDVQDRVAVVVNGNAKRVTDELVDMLDQIVQSGDLFVSRSLEEGREIAPHDRDARLSDRAHRRRRRHVRAGRHLGDASPATRSRRSGRARLSAARHWNAVAWVLGAHEDKGKGVVADLGRLRKAGGSRKLRLLDVEGTLTPFAGSASTRSRSSTTSRRARCSRGRRGSSASRPAARRT